MPSPKFENSTQENSIVDTVVTIVGTVVIN